MNYLVIIVSGIFLLFMFRGYRKGMIRTLAASVSLIFSVVLVSFVNPYVTEFLENQTPVYQILIEKCEVVVPLESVERAGEQMQEQAIDSLPFPELIRNLLRTNNTEEVYKELAVKNLRDYITHFMADLLIKLISFVLSWLLIYCAIRVLMIVLNVVTELPVIHGVNHLLGIGLGMIEALLIVWILFLVITIVSNTELGMAWMKMIWDSKALRFLYDKNVFLMLFTPS
ncbi:MAG: CvpA family protein [Muricoprocola sp.]